MNRPIVGREYSPREQANMHGGSPFQCAPISGGRVALLRFRPEWNPEAPNTIQWHTRNDAKLPMIEAQSQEEPLPVYLRRGPNAWEYMGDFRVVRRIEIDGKYADGRGRVYHRIEMASGKERS